MIMHYNSFTKLFTAVTIFQLMEEKKLALTDKVAEHLPDLAIPGADKISIQDLSNVFIVR